MILDFINTFDDFLWEFLAIPALVIMGCYLAYQFRFAQVTSLYSIWKELYQCFFKPLEETDRGVHPIYAFFTTMGGCIGVGNIIAVCTAVKIGGPGSLFWMWIAALIGMTVKYSEILLSMQTRVSDQLNGYEGGPMYYIRTALSKPWAIVFAVLLSVYGVEVFMFKAVTESVSQSWNVPAEYVTVCLMILVLYAVMGGAERVGKFCSWLIPGFVLIYMMMSTWVLVLNYDKIPGVFALIFKSAFVGHAPVGAFAGSGVMYAISQGVKRACYTGDIGVGYAGVVAAQAHESSYGQQARFSYIGIVLDTFVVCTLSVLLILISGAWQSGLDESMMVTYTLSQNFPGTHIFMPIFIFLLGYSTIIAFFHVGLCCMSYLSPRYGKIVYSTYAVIAFTVFSYLETHYAMVLMNICGALMLVLNIVALWLHRKSIMVT